MLPQIDDRAIQYLADATRCIDQYLPRPASVMLGVCAEIAALQLGEALITAAAPRELGKWNREPSATAKWARARRLAQDTGYVRKLEELVDQEGSDQERRALRELEDQQATLLTLIRLQRNDSGHAVSVDVDEDTVRAFTRATPRTLSLLSALLGLVEREQAAA